MDNKMDVDDEEFGFSRNYFLAKEKIGKKSTQSKKVSDINPIDENELRTALANLKPKHENQVKALVESYKSLYSKWVFNLRSGFGLLMYGFGSKKALLEDFASSALTDYTVVVINGYLPTSVNLKQVLVTLAELLWDQMKMQRVLGSSVKAQQPFSTRSVEDLLSFLEGSCVEEDGDDGCLICVVVHNIDGTALRDAESQQCLARLAACSRVRIVASIDHVNAPLLWDKKMVHSQFNWYWCHVPTYEPYKVEGRFYPLILAHGSTAQSAKTAAIVLQSLTSNAQCVFRVLAEHQLCHPDEEGMPIQNLYAECQERFLVNSQVMLNPHLTEFKDHELVKTKRNSDGQDCLHIPLSNEALEKLLGEINPEVNV